jgi:hypothetical protein
MVVKGNSRCVLLSHSAKSKAKSISCPAIACGDVREEPPVMRVLSQCSFLSQYISLTHNAPACIGGDFVREGPLPFLIEHDNQLRSLHLDEFLGRSANVTGKNSIRLCLIFTQLMPGPSFVVLHNSLVRRVRGKLNCVLLSWVSSGNASVAVRAMQQLLNLFTTKNNTESIITIALSNDRTTTPQS